MASVATDSVIVARQHVRILTAISRRLLSQLGLRQRQEPLLGTSQLIQIGFLLLLHLDCLANMLGRTLSGFH